MDPRHQQTLIDNRDRLRRATQGLDEGAVTVATQQRGRIADEAVAGRIAFYENMWTQVGRQGIDWSGRHHAHSEWRLQLNQFRQLLSLAPTYAETADDSYAQAARDYIADWMAAHPSRDWTMAPHDTTLTLAVRVQNWVETLPAFITSDAFDEAFTRDLIESIRAQLNWLLDNLKYRGNWYIAQGGALMTTGIILDFVPDAATWLSRGVSIINECFFRQILPDGAHVERNPSYHGWMRNVFERYWRIGQAMPELGLVVDAASVERMWNYSLAATRPNGAPCPLHDGQGRHTGSRGANWGVRRSDFLNAAGLPDELPPTSQFFPDAGQVFLRDSWDEDATFLSFDATPMTSPHWHASRNAIELHAFGRSLIIDPGLFTYEASDPFQGYGTCTRAHSTINLNGWDQTWSTQKIEHRAAKGYDAIWSCYDGGYWQGQHRGGWFSPGHLEGFFGAHHRTLLWIRGRAVVVIDHVHSTVTEDRRPSLECVWPLSPGPVTLDTNGRRAWTGHDDGNVLMLFPFSSEASQLRVHEGEREPLRGWVPGGRGTGQYLPAPQVVQHVDPVTLWQTNLVTVLVPFAGKGVPNVEVERIDVTPSAGQTVGGGQLALRWGDGSLDEVFWCQTLTGRVHGHTTLDTDGTLIHLGRDARGDLRQGLVVDGTYCEPFTDRVLPRPATFRLP